MSTSPHRVSDVMTHTAVAIGRHAGFKEIVELMDQWKVSALPVLEGEGRVVGVVSEADLLSREEHRDDGPATGGRPPARPDEAAGLTAEELMSAPAVTVHPDAALAEAARIMARRRVKRLPVVDSLGLLEGVVSRGDLLKVFLRPDEEIAKDVRHTLRDTVPGTERVTVSVRDGKVTLHGPVDDRALIPLLERAVRAVEGTVDTRMDLGTGTP
ncbi:CBS domain-containing protein [Streptomyces sp. NPDC006798]|uniref:CBS domain-containing protein n=1 Tax=Streptomyces sp. NPDC006798 TaxID=3155462 RepID=UPI0033CD78E0